MIKTELICESCDEQLIIVTIEDSTPNFCPMCSSPLPDENSLEMGEE